MFAIINAKTSTYKLKLCFFSLKIYLKNKNINAIMSNFEYGSNLDL